MAKDIELKSPSDKLTSMDDSQLDSIAGGGEVEWKDGMYYAYTVCPECGQKDLVSNGWSDRIAFGVKHTCSKCGTQFEDYFRIPKKP